MSSFIQPKRNHGPNFLQMAPSDDRYDRHHASKPAIPGHNDHYQTQQTGTVPTPAHSPSRPLRSTLEPGRKAQASRYRVRVYALNGGREMLGYALSEGTLRTLMESGYLKAPMVQVVGTILGEDINMTVHAFHYCGHLQKAV